ncbi:MAG: HAMP domain-containing histidine kinase, partial [Chloroflexi bacterium]|nr:HAMP domain-containing histidine kinase [Chloroflexota bacterium]
LVGALATAARHTVGRQLRRQAAFARFAQECFSDTLSWSSSLILDALVRNLSAGIGLRATVLQLDESGRHIVAAARCTPGDPWVIHPLEFCQIGLVDWPDALTVVGSRVERAYVQPHELPRLPSILLRQLALPDALLLPLTGGDRVLGLILIDHQRRRRPFAADEAAFARALGAQAGRLLTSADASRNSLTRSQQLAALYQLSLELMTQIERSRLYGAIVSAAVNLVGATAGFLVLSRPDEGRQLWATGIDEEALAGNPGRSLVELAHQCTVSAEARWQRLAGSWGALGAVPLEWDGAIIGALAVLSPAGSAPPGAAERELLRRVATQAAAAIAGVTRRGESAEAETQRRVGLVLDDVVSTICHELRAPLGLIRGYAETLLRRDRPPSDPWRTEFLDGIVRAASRMADILSDLASTRLGDAGTVLLQIEDVPLRDIVDQGLASVRDSARMRHQLLMEVPADAVVRVDRRQVERVVANLLGNAVKYSPAGTTIRVAAVRGAATVQLTVADEGIGIAPEDAPHLFEKFYRGRTVARIAPDGLGIGLYLCKRIVDAHGGTIVVERGPTGGTIVSVTLPGGRQIEGRAESE